MSAFRQHVLLSILLQVSLFGKISLYRIFYADEECLKGETVTISLGNGTDNSSGIFKASKDGRQLPEMHCNVILKPPLFSELVISVRTIDLMPPVDCHSYLQLNSSSDIRIRLCGYFHDKMEAESYFGFGDTDLIFHTEPVNSSTPKKEKMQFEIIFTVVLARWRTTKAKCNSDEFLCDNGRCIWKGLINDGHNNCGDLSDEITDTTQSNQLSAGKTLAVLIPIIVLSLALILLLVCCFGHRITAKIERLIQNEERRNEAARDALVDSGSPSRRQNYNTVAAPNREISHTQDTPAPRHGIPEERRIFQPWRMRPIDEQPPISLSSDYAMTAVVKDPQLPPYDPPPTYESVNVQVKEKY